MLLQRFAAGEALSRLEADSTPDAAASEDLVRLQAKYGVWKQENRIKLRATGV